MKEQRKSMTRLYILSLFIILVSGVEAQSCDSIKLSIEATDTLICKGDEVFLQAKIEGTNKTPQYIWSTNIDGPITSIIPEESITIKLTATISGCPEKFEKSIFIEVEELEDLVRFRADGYSATFNYKMPNKISSSYKVFYNNMACDTCYRFLNKNNVFFKYAGYYSFIFLHVGKVCTRVDSFEFVVKRPLYFSPYIPNVIVPNGRLYTNSVFKPYNEIVESYSISIFSRRGNEVFSCNEPDCFWDGRDRKGEVVPFDYYYYIIEITDIFGDQKQHVGKVMVLQ